MNYIFSSTDDLSAFWLFNLLQPKVQKLKLITEEMLWYNRHFSFHISTSSSSFKVKLEDDTIISNENKGLIINRLQKIPFEHSNRVQQGDLCYAMQESHAILFAALASFEDNIINTPTPNCLHGNQLPASRWLKKVIALGGDTIEYPFAPDNFDGKETPVLVMFGTLIFSNIPIPSRISELCIELSRWSNNLIIEFIFLKTETTWTFKSTNLMPDFKRYLDRFNIDGIVKILNQ